MQYLTNTTTLTAHETDCLILPVLANHTLSPTGLLIDEQTKGQLSRMIQTDLARSTGSTVALYEPNHMPAKRILLVYCGENSTLSALQFQEVIDATIAGIQNTKMHSMTIVLDEFPIDQPLSWTVCLAIQRIEHQLYQFTEFKTQGVAPCELATTFFYVKDEELLPGIELAIHKGMAIALGMSITKNAANTPANYATPTRMGDYAQQLAEADPNLQVTVYGKEDKEVQAMGGLLGVAQGSNEPPRFVVIQYTPPQSTEKAPIVLVGKGVTFDAGGISLKPSKDMDEMKFDMAGAASVLGTLQAISRLQVPVPVVGLLPLTENLVGGSAMKPGDVLKTLSGQTVEVLNTDAEGRLILADALTYSRQFNPSVVIDIATLTGAVEVALGGVATGLMTTDFALQQELEQAGKSSADPVWPLPLWDAYQNLIQSHVADMSNLGIRGAGAITAACFLSRFTEGLRWAHLDIAGTAYLSGRKKRATARPVPLLVEYILNYCHKQHDHANAQ